jgi:hypothetical protein
LQRLRRHDRFAHGFGVVCGLYIYAAPDRLHPWTIGVCPGYAVGPCGDEIEVPSRVLVDIRNFSWSRPYVNGVAQRNAFVGLRFADTAGSPEESSCDCGCSSAGSGDSSTHIQDSYVIEVVWSLETARTPTVDPCKPGPVPCPAVPVGRHVMLAAVRLPAFESTPLTDADVVQL